MNRVNCYCVLQGTLQSGEKMVMSCMDFALGNMLILLLSVCQVMIRP